MERQEVVEFIQKEAKRLIEEQHIDDLIKANRFDELSNVESRLTKSVHDFIRFEFLSLQNEEIPKGDCAEVLIWLASCTSDSNDILFEDVKTIAHRAAREAYLFGKNVAALMLDGKDLCDIPSEEFYSDKHAKEYDEKYGVGAD